MKALYNRTLACVEESQYSVIVPTFPKMELDPSVILEHLFLILYAPLVHF